MKRNLIPLLAAANYVLAIAIYIIGSGGYGIASAMAFSKFRDLEFHHVVSVDAANLEQIENVSPSNSDDIPHYLTEGFRGNLTVIYFSSGACIANGLLWTGYFLLLRQRQDSTP